MTLIAPLPEGIRGRLPLNTHPGLLLDKYVASWDPMLGTGKLSERVQKPALKEVVRLSQREPEGFDYASLCERREQSLNAVRACLFRCTTTGPLTLHLARASALENAGICLHPLYGFVYLPGSGLKGMARAYAETVWLPAQFEADEQGQPQDECELEKAAQGWQKIEAVFGWAPGSDIIDRKEKSWKPPGIPRHEKGDREHAGSIVFHDAWPTRWPKLIVDILNNHHHEYYSAREHDRNHPPGDWENPVPVYFLAVEPGAEFQFPLGKRREDVDDAFLELARQWLFAALCHAGAGAKTAAGYGSFRPSAAGDAPPPLASRARAVFEATVELVTPAFLAGAEQRAEDCDLRPAALRGLLRWWWRTMHAGFVDVPTLRQLEAALWGNTQQGGAIRVEVVRGNDVRTAPYDYKDRFDPKPDFAREHHLARRPDQKTTQGLFYASYGMDESGRYRHYVEPGASWTIRLTARPVGISSGNALNGVNQRQATGIRLSTAEVLEQAAASLWLLCTHGAVGSKSRKGFGSLQIVSRELPSSSVAPIGKLDDCRACGARLRERLGLNGAFSEQNDESGSLGRDTDVPAPLEIPLPYSDSWTVVDEIGFAYQAFAKSKAHNPAKAALGLPRKIHGPRDDGPMRNQTHESWQRPKWLDFPRRDRRTSEQNARHASPVHIHVARSPDGNHVVRVVAFPASSLPDRAKSRAFLEEFLAFFETELKQHAQAAPPPPTRPQPGAVATAAGRQAHAGAGQASWVRVRVTVVSPHDKLLGAYFVREEGQPRGILQHGRPPQGLPSAGDVIDVFRNPSCNPQSPQYRWTPPDPAQAMPRGRGPGQGRR